MMDSGAKFRHLGSRIVKVRMSWAAVGAIVVGFVVTVLPNVYFHYLPAPTSPSTVPGTIIAVSNDQVTLYDLGRHRTVQVVLPNIQATGRQAQTAGNDSLALTDPFWEASQGLFWVNASATGPTGKILEGDIAAINGRGLYVRTEYTSPDEDLDWATPAPGGRYVVYQAHQAGRPSHLALVKSTNGAGARRIAETGGRASWNASGSELAFACDLGGNYICIYDVASGQTRRLIVAGYDGILDPVFAPQGDRILAKASTGPGITPVILVVAGSTGKVLAVNRDVENTRAVAWSPSGQQTVYAGPNGARVCLELVNDCAVTIRGDFDEVQWVPGTVQGFGYP